jgi:hypothetical protein
MTAGARIYEQLDPLTKANLAADSLGTFTDAVARQDYIVALRHAGNFAEAWSSLVADVCQAAFDAGATKAGIARALGVPPSTFRGMVKTS